MEPRDPLMLVLHRPEIEALNLRPFLRRFGSDTLPKGAELAALTGCFNFIVHGYDDDPQEVYRPRARGRFTPIASTDAYGGIGR